MPSADRRLVIIVCSCFGIGGAALVSTGVHGVLEACRGRPNELAGVAIVANIALLVGVAVAVPLHLLADAPVQSLPAIVWATAACWQALRRRPRADPAVHQQDTEGRSTSTQTLALALGAVTATGIPVILTAAAAQLSAGTTTVLYIVTRIITSVIGLGLNSVLLVRFNWASVDGPRNLRYLVRPPLLAALACAATGCAFRVLIPDHAPAGYVAVVLSLVFALAPAAVVNREVNQRRLSGVVMYKACLDLALASAATVYFSANPSVSGFFGVYLLSQAVTTVVGSLGLRRTADVAPAVLLGVAAAAFVIWGW